MKIKIGPKMTGTLSIGNVIPSKTKTRWKIYTILRTLANQIRQITAVKVIFVLVNGFSWSILALRNMWQEIGLIPSSLEQYPSKTLNFLPSQSPQSQSTVYRSTQSLSIADQIHDCTEIRAC
jgi:hypothetical protein